ncbi:MAG: hypothetical protein IPH13_10650 [Planctomycetes bacterium]|nr:hypothetical protein [Planctomycetota bacterium]
MTRAPRRPFGASLVFAFTLVSFGVDAFALQDPERPAATERDTTLANARSALIRGDVAVARELLDAALAQDGTWTDARTLRGFACIAAGDDAGAIADFTEIARREPTTPAGLEARFALGQRLAVLGRHAEAATETADAVAFLRSPERRHSLALVYASTAAQLLRPEPGALGAAPPSPQHTKALVLLQLAEGLGALGAEQNAVSLDVMRCLHALGQDPAGVVRRAAALRAADPNSSDLAEIDDLEGHARARMADGTGALLAWRRAAVDPTRPFAARALEDAARMFAKSAEFPNMLDAAVDLAEDMLGRMPTHEKTPAVVLDVVRELATAERGSARALQLLDAFLRTFPDHALVADAIELQDAVLVAQGRHDEGALRLTAFLTARPADAKSRPIASRLRDRRFDLASAATAEIATAANTTRATAVAAARARWNDFLAAYPLDDRAPDAAFALASIDAGERDFDAALQRYTDLRKRFTGEATSHRAALEAARLLANEKQAFDAAFTALAEIPLDSPFSAQARQVEGSLRATELGLDSGVLAPGRSGTLTLHLRNLETATISIYRVRADDVFTAHGSAAALGTIDVTLITPERSFEVRVDRYVPYRRVDVPVELPAEAASTTLVVTARSGDHEARAIALFSSLAFAAVVSPSAIEPIAFDRTSGEPIDSVAVRAAFDGTASPISPPIPPSDGFLTLGLFARASIGDAFASATFGRRQIPPAPVEAAATLLAEAPRYHPGDTVHVFGVVRDAEGGRVRPWPTDKALRWVWADERGEWLDVGVRAMPTSEGLVHGSFDVPKNAIGSRSIVCRLEHDRTGEAPRVLASTTFAVEPMSSPETTVTWEDEHGSPASLAAGMTTRTVLRVRSRQPMAAVEVRWRVGDDDEVRALTDELGRVIVPIDGTRTTYADSVRMAVVTLGQTFAFEAPVTRAELEWRLADRAVVEFAAGEPATLALIADAGSNSAPAGARARITIRRSSAVARGPTLATQDVVADAAGRASVSFTPAEPGPYVAWLEWTLGNGSSRTTSIGLIARGPSATPGLWILPPAGVLPHGGRVALRVFAAIDAGPALFVTHGRTLHAVRIVRLEPGWNTVELTLPDLPATHCAVSVRALHGTTSHAASANLVLAPSLRMELAVEDGATRRASLHVTDGAGAPVAAEVAYWLVHAADASRIAAELAPATTRGLDGPVAASTLVFDGDVPLPQSAGAVDVTVERALREIESAAKADAATVLVDALDLDALAHDRPLMPGEAALESEANAGSGVAGGGGSKYGSRGRRLARGGGESNDSRTAPMVRAALARRLDARTDTDGRSTWELPPRLEPGSYAVVALACAGAVRVATTSAEFRVHVDVDVRIAAPTLLRTSDRARVRVELENRTDAARSVALALETTLSDLPVRTTVELAARGARHVTLALPALRDGAGLLRVRAEGRSFESPLAVVPDGVQQHVAAATSAAGERTALALPEGVPLDAAELVLDASAPAALLSLAEEPETGDVPGDLRAAALRLLTEVEALRATLPFASDAAARRDPIRARAQRRLHRLGWWLAEPQALDPLLAYAIGRAPMAELTVPEGLRTRVAAALTERFAQAATDGDQAWLLFCRQSALEAEFGRVNRLVRAKSRLDVGALALLANALAHAGMTAAATDVMTELRGRLAPGAPGRPAPAIDPFARVSTDEVSALALDAARALNLDAHEILALAGALDASATPAIGSRLARVLALRAESAYAATGSTRFEARSGDVVLAALVDAKPWQSARVLVTQALLDRRVECVRTGPATAARARLSQSRSVARERLPLASVDVSHRFWRLDEVRDGVRVGVGDSVLQAATRTLDWNVFVTLAPTRRVDLMLSPTIGEITARTSWWFMPDVGGFTLDVLSGARRVLRDEHGTWLEIDTPIQRDVTIHLDVAITADHPGTFAVPSLLLSRAPSTFDARANGGGPSVISTDAPDDVGPGPAWTPDERLGAARSAISRGDLARTAELIAPLLDVELDTDAAREVNRMALLCAVETDDAARMVQCFEFAKERDPDFVVSFAATAKVAGAYRSLGEHERARQVDLALADAGFLEEAQIVGALEQVDRALEAARIMVRLLRELPDTELARRTAFALAQRAADHARSAQSVPDPATFTAAMRAIAIATLEHRVIESPRADDSGEVLLTLADLHRENLDYAAMDAVAVAALRRTDLGRLAPAFEFERAVAALAQRRLDDALATARRIAAARSQFPGDEVIEHLAAQGRHIEAQVLQVRGDYDGARVAYADVKDRFADAARELEFLERAGLEVPELTTVRSGEPMRLAVKVRGQAKSVEVQVYKVDLQLLYLKQRGFDRLRDVRLAGLPPFWTSSVPVPAASAQAMTLELALPDAGAYLVVLRAGEQQARSIAIRSDLALDVRDDVDAGVRAHVWRADSRVPADGATVTGFDAASGRFVTKRADLRGVAEFAGVVGPVALIAEQGGHYAYFQGTTKRDHDSKFKQQDKLLQDADTNGELRTQFLEDAQFRNDATWKDNTNRRQQGVEVQRAKQ